MIIATSIYICINLILILRHMKDEPKHERLPWILFLCSAFTTIPGLVLHISSFNFMNSNNTALSMMIRIFSLCIISGPMIAGFLLEAFKPSWKHRILRWWLITVIPVILAGYFCLMFIFGNDSNSSNDMLPMVDFGVLVLLPFLASIFPLAKVPDKENLKIYRLISAGFGLMVLSLVVFMFYSEREVSIYIIVIADLISSILIAHATYLKRKQAQVRKQNDLG